MPTLQLAIILRARNLGKRNHQNCRPFFTEEEISRLSVVASNIKLNIIRDYEVVEKKEVVMPEELKGIVKCNNPKCISNNEPMQTWFHVIDKEKGLLKCHYCEKNSRKTISNFCKHEAGLETRNYDLSASGCLSYMRKLRRGI